jgi:hypothetical protein
MGPTKVEQYGSGIIQCCLQYGNTGYGIGGSGGGSVSKRASTISASAARPMKTSSSLYSPTYSVLYSTSAAASYAAGQTSSSAANEIAAQQAMTSSSGGGSCSAGIAGPATNPVQVFRAYLHQYCITIGSGTTFVSALCVLRRLNDLLGPELSS